MAAIAGEAAVRIVPAVRGFHGEVKRSLEKKRIEYKVDVGANLDQGQWAKVEAMRKAQEARPITVRVRTDWDGLRRDLSQVEHIFKRNSFSRALRLNVVIAGLDLLPVLSYGAAGAAASLTTLAKAALALPGAFGGAIASIGTLGVGLHGVKDAFAAFDTTQKKTAENARLIADGTRQLERSYRDYGRAVRDTVRDIQDLNAENRRSSLNVADAILGVQEAADRLRQGGQRTILELRRDQLSYLQAVDRLQEVNTKAKRVAEDTAEANAKGVQGADKVADALDQINKNIEKLNTDKMSKLDEAFSKLSPNAQAFVTAVRGMKGEWTSFQNSVQDKLFAGLDKSVVDLANNTLPMLERGMGRVSTSLNGMFKGLANELGSKNSVSLMERVFGNTDVGLQRLSVGIRPFVDGMLKLTKESSDFLPRLGEAGAKVAQRFNNWVYAISSDGRLDRWIDRGLDGFTSLGNTIANLGGALSTMTEAFDSATGNQGGFLKLLERQSKKLADYLKSPKGQNDMNSYFKKTQEFIRALKDAYVDIKPLIKDVVEAARDWSLFLFRSIGYVVNLTEAIDKHLGILKPLIGTYFLYRTAKPVWEMLAGSFKAYTNLIESAGNNSTLGKWKFFDWQMQKLDQMRGKAQQTANAVNQIGSSTASAGYQPGQQVSASKVQSQAAQRGVGAYANPLFAVTQAGKVSGPGPVKSPTIPAAPMYGPIAPLVLPANLDRPNSRLSKNQRAAKAEALALYREKSSQFYDYAGQSDLRGKTYAAPALGAMQGPQLPPEVFTEMDRQAKLAEKSVAKVGDASETTSGKVNDLGKNADAAAKNVGSTGDKSKTSKTQVEDLGKKSSAAAKGTDALNTSASKAATAASSVGTAAANAAPGVKSVGDAADDAAGKVGTRNVGMLGRLVGLAGFIAPTAGLMVALGAVSWAVNKMGEAHREAAEAAKAQDDALRNLAGTLDAVTGGFTRQTLAQIGANAAQFRDQSNLYGTNDVNQIIGRLGLDANSLYLNAGDPSKSANFQSDMAVLDNLVEQQVRNSPEYQQNKQKFDAYNLDSMTLAKALRGDPSALAAVRAAESNRKFVTGPGGKSIPIVTPDLGALGVSLPNKDAFLAGRFLTDLQQSNAAQGAAAASANMTLGRARLRPGAGDIFQRFGPDATMFIDPGTGNGVIQLRQVPDQATIEDWSSKGIEVVDNGPGAMAKVTIEPAEAEKYLERYATGGLVRGPGGPTSDSILARVSAGEHITNASAVQYYGAELFQALNDRKLPRFAPGGWPWNPLGPFVPTPDPNGNLIGGAGDAAASPAAPPKPSPVTPPEPPKPAAAPPKPAAPPATPGASPFTAAASTTAMPPITPFIPGTPLPPSRTGGEQGLQVNAIGLKRTIETLFPAIQSIGGWREDPIPDHPSGAAIDVMVPAWDTPEGKAYGDQISQWLKQYGPSIGVKSFIWQDTWHPVTVDGEPHRLNRSGANEGHYNHLHILTDGGGMPTGNEQYRMPNVGAGAAMNPALAQLFGSVFPGGLPALLQMTGNGTYLGGVTPDMLGGGGKPAFLGDQQVGNFLSSQFGSIGSSLLNIGTSFLSGITGIDFGWISGMVGQIGNAGVSAVQGWTGQNGAQGNSNPGASMLDSLIPGLGGMLGGMGGGGATDATNAAGALIYGMVNGQLPLEDPNVQKVLSDTGFNQNLDGMGAATSSSGVVSEADIAAAVDQMAPLLKLKNKKAWVDALVKSSKGNAKIFESDSANYGTGIQKAGAALNRAVREWGVDPNTGGPKTPSYAMGGGAGHGLAWLSNGEFRNSPASTRYYGPGLFNALNAKAIPRAVARRMLKGGVPRFDSGGLFGNPGGNGMTDKEKATMSQLLFLYGKNNLTASDREHMTPQVQSLKEQVAQQFNSEIGDINGWRPPDITPYGNFTEHSSGQALDVWLNGPIRQSDGQMLPPADPTIGNRVRDFMLGRGADYVLWNQTEFDKGGGQSAMGVRDGSPTMRHTNHAHGRVKPGTQIASTAHPNSLGQLLLPGYAGGGMVNPHSGDSWIDKNGNVRIGATNLLPTHENLILSQYKTHTGIFNGNFADGGWPKVPDPMLNPPGAQGQSAGPLPMPPPQPPAPPAPAPAGPAAPNISVGAQQDSIAVPSTGGEPGPGATAPAPDPGSLPQVNDALASIGGMGGILGGGGGVPQPGASAPSEGDPRATLGAAPTSQNHTNPALSGLISGAASAIGSIASLAAKGAIAGGTMGGGAALAMAPGAGSAMDAGIQAGAQMAGAVVNGAVNILSSLMVGTATNGSTASASGIPLLPQRQPMQTGVPAMGQQYSDNRTYNLTNLDEYRRLQERDAAQQANPFIGKF